jgi:hypothetical protein
VGLSPAQPPGGRQVADDPDLPRAGLIRPAALVLAVAAALWLAAPAAGAPLWPQPTVYTASLRYDAHAQTLTGTERIAFVASSPSALPTVWLRVWPNGYGSCSRRWAHVTVTAGGRADGWSVGCTALRVKLAHALAPGRPASLRLGVLVKVPPTSNRFGQDHGVVFLGNALPLLAVEDASGPSLEPYTDLGDPFYSLSSRWEVRLDLPSSLEAATTGVVHRRVTSGSRRVLSIVASRARDFSMVLGRFAVDTVKADGGVRLRRFRLRGVSGGRARSMATLSTARAAFDTYVSWYGPPGESEVDLAPNPSSLSFGAGMEFPGLVLATDDPRVVAHELAHQWWYGMVGDDQWASPWLDESFAEFSARRLPASIVGPDDLSCDDADPVRPFGSALLSSSMKHWDPAGADEYYRTVYLGGTCALRSLESDLGFDGMTAFLRSYAAAHRFGVVTKADFESALRAAAPPGYDVDAYLRRARIEP